MGDKRADFIDCLKLEIAFIDERFPGNEKNLAALMEEAGELANALIERDRPTKEGAGASDFDVFKEAVQLAAMAFKIASRSSAEFHLYQWPDEAGDRFDEDMKARCQKHGVDVYAVYERFYSKGGR